MPELSDLDKRLLEAIQSDFPLTERPFIYFAEQVGMSEETAIARLQELQAENIIRNISAILHAPALNYKSALVSASVPEQLVEEVAAQISMHPGVSHNYLREDVYNIWFTLTLSAEKDHQTEVNNLLSGKHPFLVLPAIETFKIGVHFRFDSDRYDHDMSQIQRTDDVVQLDETDKLVIRSIQGNIPLVAEPWKQLAQGLGITHADFINRLQRFKNEGALKRISATLRHRKIGISANGMACFSIPESRVKEAGHAVAQSKRVTHCYHRAAYPQWPFTLYAMIHSKEREDCKLVAEELAQISKADTHKILFSVKEFKKERVKYFYEI